MIGEAQAGTSSSDPPELPVASKLVAKGNLMPIRFHADGSLLCVGKSNLIWSQGQRIVELAADGKVLAEFECPALKDCWPIFFVTKHNQIITHEKARQGEQQLVISQYNFEKKELVQVFLRPLSENLMASPIQLFYFKESNILCHCENFKQLKFLLSYFKLPLINSHAPFHKFVIELPQTTFGLKQNRFLLRAVQLNNKGMIGFFPPDFELKNGKISFALYDLDEEHNKETLNIIQLDFDFNPNKHEFLSAEIKDIWEVLPQVLYIQVQTSVMLHKYKPDPSFDLEKQQRYHTLYYNMKDNSTRVGKVNIAEPHRLQFVNSMRPLNYQEEKRFSFELRLSGLNYYAFMNNVGVPIYYIEPDNEAILAVTPPLESPYGQSFEWLVSSDDIFLKVVRIDESQVTEIHVLRYPDSWLIYQEGLNIVTAFLMTEVVGDCNDDLLDLICQLLE